MPLSVSQVEDFVLVETSDGPSQVICDKQLASMTRNHSGELILGKTNITTFGLTKFIEELTTGYRKIPLCTLFVNPARCNITAIMYGFKAKFNPTSNEYEIHNKEYSVYIMITRRSSKSLEPIDVRIRTVSLFE